MTTTTPMTPAAGTTDGVDEAALLIEAGAVLPAGTEGAGPGAVDLTARTYRHPGLPEGRVVVRLSAAELGAAEDLAAGFLGLVPDGEPAVVGLGRRRALGFAEWVLVHHPEDGHHALALVPELERVARQAKSKPKAALESCHELAGRLAAAVPHFLPVFYEETARVFLSVENPTYAAQLFTRARKSEAGHGLAVDDDRLDAVFLEFALAGALPVRVLTSYAKDLELRVPAAEAYGRYRRLCVRRTAGGMVPSAQVAPALRRLARSAGLDAVEAEQDYLAELLALPATLRATAGWWKTHRSALVGLARREPAVRGALLSLTPQGEDSHDGELSRLWLDILEESGATAGLVSATAPDGERCADGTAGWLERFHAARHRGWGRRLALPLLLDVVRRSADVLRAELTAPDREAGREAGLRIGVQDVDLLDLLLSLGLPVASPAGEEALGLEAWAEGEERRDLLALAADERFRPAFTRAANGFHDNDLSASVVRRVAAAAGGRPMLAEWVRTVARASADTGLPLYPQAVHRLTWLPAEALVLAEGEVADAAATDLGGLVARTLRGGLFEELVWPAWEEALAELDPKRENSDLTVVSAWPHLIVANQRQVRVIDAHSAVLVHDLRIPGTDRRTTGFHYVDGALLVCWRPWYGGGATQGYWHTDPDHVFTVDTGRHPWRLALQHIGLPLAGGGLATGAGVLHRGDTRLPDERVMISDGPSYWTWQSDGTTHGWTEYDPASDTTGRRALPAFLTDALQGHPDGSTLSEQSSWLRPGPAVEGSVLSRPAGGLLGWRVVRLPGGGWRACDTAGREVSVPKGDNDGAPLAAIVFPGDDRPRAVSSNWHFFRLVDPDGAVTAEAPSRSFHGSGAHGHRLPPADHWFCLRPRDPEGSSALRGVDRDAAAALLASAAETPAGELPALVRAGLPRITDEVLVQGIARTVRFALAQRTTQEKITERLARAVRGGTGESAPQGPADTALMPALDGLSGTVGYRWGGRHNQGDHACRAMAAVAAVRADTGAVAEPGRLHCEMPGLPHSNVPWTRLLEQPAALAYRAVAATTSEEDREALLAFLREMDGLGVPGGSGGWRRSTVRLTHRALRKPDGTEHHAYHSSVLPLGGGALLVTGYGCDHISDGIEMEALHYDPAGTFTMPAPYTLVRDRQLGDPGRADGWTARFLDEAAERGAVSWRPEAAEEFARLTGASGTMARLVLAGLPAVDSYEQGFLTPEQRTVLSVKASEAAVARDELKALTPEVRRELVAALLPADPARLWTHGPEVAAAAEVWNGRVGRRVAVPEWLTVEAHRGVRTSWPALRSLPAVLDPAAAPALSTDVAWLVKGDRVQPEQSTGEVFSADVLTGSVAMIAWLAHRLPAGDPVRALLPSALAAIRKRLVAPELMMVVGWYVNLKDFRKAAGAPTRTAEHYEEYGAVVLPTHDGQPVPAVRPALLDSAGRDPYLPLLRGAAQHPFPVEAALRVVHDARFAALLADPGAPGDTAAGAAGTAGVAVAAGVAGADGTWWPQDPTRSVPELVGEAAEAYGLGADAAALYLMLLAMPDPTDRNTARWTGWKPARMKAARAELGATDLVVTASRTRAGRGLFLPGGWVETASPALPLEQWKAPMHEDLLAERTPLLGVLVPTEPPAELYRRAWQRVREGDVPRFTELKVRRVRRR
ncbi:DNA-binding protein [Streptomyces sp. NPDC048603]|uniref:DNA-binding protein n=1 Tax=Streptomyces sp. NPDC048603 TaxID=3365577 RepID=UPI003719177B